MKHLIDILAYEREKKKHESISSIYRPRQMNPLTSMLVSYCFLHLRGNFPEHTSYNKLFSWFLLNASQVTNPQASWLITTLIDQDGISVYSLFLSILVTHKLSNVGTWKRPLASTRATDSFSPGPLPFESSHRDLLPLFFCQRSVSSRPL